MTNKTAIAAAISAHLRASKPLLDSDQIAKAAEIAINSTNVTDALNVGGSTPAWLATEEGAKHLLSRLTAQLGDLLLEAPDAHSVYLSMLAAHEELHNGQPADAATKITLHRTAAAMTREERAASGAKIAKPEAAKTTPAPISASPLPGTLSAPNYGDERWFDIISRRVGEHPAKMLPSRYRAAIDAMLKSASDNVPRVPDDGRDLMSISSPAQRMTLFRQRQREASK